MTKILLICYKLQAVAYYVANNVFKVYGVNHDKSLK